MDVEAELINLRAELESAKALAKDGRDKAITAEVDSLARHQTVLAKLDKSTDWLAGTSGMVDEAKSAIGELKTNVHDLNLSLSDTNCNVEDLMQRVRQLEAAAPGDSTAEMELAGELLETQENLKKAMQLIKDIRDLARARGDMNHQDWDSIGARSVGLLQRHKMI